MSNRVVSSQSGPISSGSWMPYAASTHCRRVTLVRRIPPSLTTALEALLAEALGLIEATSKANRAGWADALRAANRQRTRHRLMPFRRTAMLTVRNKFVPRSFELFAVEFNGVQG